MNFDRIQTERFAVEIRKSLLRAIASKGSGHVGGSLSIADVLAVLYSGVMKVDPADPGMEDRDYLVISKGHAGPAMYAALALKGFFPQEALDTLNRGGTMLPSHTDRLKTPGIDLTTGSLGQGASLAAGAAFADKLDCRDNYTYLILGDGELNEGQVWESVMFAVHQKLSRLITFVDANGKQLDGTTDEICTLGDIAAKFAAFGCNAVAVEDGNDTEQIYQAIISAKQETQKPTVIVLHTVKGAGVSRYEKMKNCHSCGVTEEDLKEAYKELDDRKRSL